MSLLVLAAVDSRVWSIVSLLLVGVCTLMSMWLVATGVGLGLFSCRIGERARVLTPALATLSVGFGLWYGVGVLDTQRLCATAGVALVLTPELGKTRLSGAAHWPSSDKAIVQLSIRHKSDDHLWFSLYHECGHVIRSRRQDIVDSIDRRPDDGDDEEKAADRFARDILIPPADFARFIATRVFTAETVRGFAKQQGIAAGIVVGRLQRERHVPASHLNQLKKRITWPRPR